MAQALFNMPRFPLKNLRKVQAVISLGKKYSPVALENACSSALELGNYSYRFINLCAKNYREPKDNKTQLAPIRQQELICLQGGIHE